MKPLFPCLVLAMVAGQASAQTPTAIVYGNYAAIEGLNDTTTSQAYPWISADGLRLYHTRQVLGGNRIHLAARTSLDEAFTLPTTAVLPAFNEDQLGGSLSADELTLWFSSGSQIMRAQRTSIGGAFGTPQVITLNGLQGTNPKSPTVTPDGQELFVFTSAGMERLTRTNSTTYAGAGPLSGVPADMGPCKLSQDGLKIYFSATYAEVLRPHRMSRATLGQPFSDLQYLDGPAFVAPLRFVHPHLTPDEALLFGVVTPENTWSLNDLFSAGDPGATAVPTGWRKAEGPSPNPASDRFWMPDVDAPVDLTVQSANGTVVLRTRLGPDQVVRVDGLAEGVYWVRRHDRPAAAWRLVIAR